MAPRHDRDPSTFLAAREKAAKAPSKGKGAGLTGRVKLAIELMVHGDENEPERVFTVNEAGDKAGISGRALRAALLKPAPNAYFMNQCQALRNNERAASLRKIVEIRDDTTLKTPAGRKVQLEAARTLAFDMTGQGGVGVTVNLNVTERPGYVIDLSSDEHDTRPIIDHRTDYVPGIPIEANECPPAPSFVRQP